MRANGENGSRVQHPLSTVHASTVRLASTYASLSLFASLDLCDPVSVHDLLDTLPRVEVKTVAHPYHGFHLLLAW